MFRIDADLREFIESGVAGLVGTGDGEARPSCVYGWAARVGADGATVDVFIDTDRAERTIANLRSNGRIALTLADPVSYRSVQLKGTFREAAAADDAERAWVQSHREAFLTITTLIGDPPAVVRNLWLDDVMRVTFAPEAAFDQTPGPGAGKPL
jgi:Pyridoxamine 5'-phosphate oxidase